MCNLAIIILVGVVYYFFITLTGLSIKCPFYMFTGYKCPGCGITTMFLRLAELDFQGAYMANPFVFITMPFILYELWHSVRGANSRFNNIVLCLYIVALIVFGFMRNM